MEDNTGYLTLLMNLAGPIVLGLVILYLVLRTRRVNWRRRQHTERATETIYDRTEQQRARQERSADAERDP